MLKNTSSYTGEDRRKYARIRSTIPVQFRLQSLDKKQLLSDWLLGSTKDIGRGGICLRVSHFRPEFAALIKNRQVRLLLDLEMPLIHRSVCVVARVVWMREVPDETNRYHIGLAYEDPAQIKTSRLVWAVIIEKYLFLFLGLLIFSLFWFMSR